MTSSSSAGAKVQVEYSICPPGWSMSAAFKQSCFWIWESSWDFSGVQSLARASSLRNMPSPEQGASRMILWKNSGKFFTIFSGFSLATKRLGIPKSSRLRRRALALVVLMSLATRRPAPFRADPTAVAFPPGAAHMSSTYSPGSTGMREAGVMALGS